MADDYRGYGTLAQDFYRTNDGGRSWVPTKVPDVSLIDHLYFLTPELGWLSGASGVKGRGLLVFRTLNGGANWEESRIVLPKEPAFVRDLFFLDRLHGWLITWGYNDDGTYLYSTVDGGKSWIADPDLSFQGRGKWSSVVRFTSPDRGFVFVDDRTSGKRSLMYTSDGGSHWREQALDGFVYDCQVFMTDLLCSSAPGFRLLTVHQR